jgi:hypothetical protein
MSRSFPTEFVYQIASLLIGFIIVHATYVAVIRPNAEVAMMEQNRLLQENPDYIPRRSYFVVVRDYEQEACFVLMLWALAMTKILSAWRRARASTLTVSPRSRVAFASCRCTNRTICCRVCCSAH